MSVISSAVFYSNITDQTHGQILKYKKYFFYLWCLIFGFETKSFVATKFQFANARKLGVIDSE
jgi:hypothetical protein